MLGLKLTQDSEHCYSRPLGEILAPLENQSLTDCGKALGDI